MLAFMKEQESQDPPAQKKSPAGDDANQKENQEFLTVATHGKRTRKTTILLAALFCAGLICLFFMIKKSGPKEAAAAAGKTEDKEVELAIARLTGIKSEIYTRMDEIVRKFDEFSDVQQVDVSQLARNPFRHDVFLSDLKEMSDTQERDAALNDEAIRKQQLALQARGMHLLSIMQSERGKCCMIDDKILYENDSIKGFTVSQIGNSAVSLKADGVQIVLKLSQ